MFAVEINSVNCDLEFKVIVIVRNSLFGKCLWEFKSSSIIVRR